jgi:hypothetical protein
MIELTHTSAPTMTTGACQTDVEIWNAVLARRPGWRLKTLSSQLARADTALMFSLVDAAAGAPPAAIPSPACSQTVTTDTRLQFPALPRAG